jgi:hypothetical protein
MPRAILGGRANADPPIHRAPVMERHAPPAAEPPIRVLIEQLRSMERRREDATPGSSEYTDLVGFEWALVDEIRERILALDARGQPEAARPDPQQA